MKHRCIYLKGNDGEALGCWQKSKKVSRAECTRCLLAYIVGSLYTSPQPRLPATRSGGKK